MASFLICKKSVTGFLVLVDVPLLVWMLKTLSAGVVGIPLKTREAAFALRFSAVCVAVEMGV